MPFFSVVIPLYNKEKYIEDTLKSVLAQTFRDFEVLVINDGSADSGEEKVLAFSDARIRYFSKANEGVSIARNFGIASAQSHYVTFLDADDYWYPDFLECMHQNISKFPGHHVFSGAIEKETGNRVFPAYYSIDKTGPQETVNYFEASQKETVICTSCAVFHKDVFKKSGVFDVQMKSGQDTDLWIRIGLDYHVVFDWKIFARYVFDPESLSKDKSHMDTRINFSRYAAAERTNPGLKKFLDLNRFSIAVKSKINGNDAYYSTLAKEIDLKNLSLKKRILLRLPAFILKNLVGLQHALSRSGIGSTPFK